MAVVRWKHELRSSVAADRTTLDAATTLFLFLGLLRMNYSLYIHVGDIHDDMRYDKFF